MRLHHTFLILLALTFAGLETRSQSVDLPKGFARGEMEQLPLYNAMRSTSGFTSPPGGPLRSMAEWEEIEYLVVTWTGYVSTVREIVRNAVSQAKVLIVCTDSNVVKTSLTNNNIPLTNVRYLQASYNSVWMRDYGANSVYRNNVDSLILVEWIYNRPRPLDDALPTAIANKTSIPLYSTTLAPNDLVHTGGNYHTDGFNTAFSSELVLDENAVGNPYSVTPKTSAEIDSVMHRFMGIERYIKMPTLPYDGIHHIDMHWRLLDEETLLIGQYPAGTSDGPQIEANLQYVLANHMSVWGTPYRVVRIQQPPDANGNYPSQGDYRTYANNVFVNKTLLLPTYAPQYDTTAIRILQEELPGVNIVSINCNQIIQASGALHCITREVGVADPLQIAHQRLRDTYDTQNPYAVVATIRHRSGILSATLHWTTDTTQGFQTIPMVGMAQPDRYFADIPQQAAGTRVFYYVSANSNSGKTQVRPVAAPQGWWKFDVLSLVANDPTIAPGWRMEAPFPNPGKAITCIPVHSDQHCSGKISLSDMQGRVVQVLHEGIIPAGESKYFLQANEVAAGAYLLVLEGEFGRSTQRMMIR